MKGKGIILLLCVLILSCSRPFDKIPKGESGASPKQRLLVHLVDPSSFIGRLARPSERSTPLIVGDTLYVGSIHDQFLAVKKKSGTPIWKKDISGGVESSPEYFSGKIYFGANDGFFYCVDAKTGKTLWTYKTETDVLSKPLVRGGIVYFQTVMNALYALQAETGKWVWYFNKGYNQKISMKGTASPVYDDGKIYTGFSDGTFYALNAFSGVELWHQKLAQEDKFVDIDVTPIIDQNKIFTGTSDGYIYALKLSNGETVWQKKVDGIRALSADSKKLFLSQLSDTVIALSKTNGERLWGFKTQQGIPSESLVVEDQLIFGTTKNFVYSINTENGSEIWRYSTDTGILSRPVFDSDHLYLYSEFSTLHVVDPFYLLANNGL